MQIGCLQYGQRGVKYNAGEELTGSHTQNRPERVLIGYERGVKYNAGEERTRSHTQNRAERVTIEPLVGKDVHLSVK